jgi:multiple sugar transport system substrate-binding protein
MYAVPWSAKGNFLFYRQDLVPEPPKTWEELRQACEQLPPRIVQRERLRYCVLINWESLENDLYPTLWGLSSGSDANDSADSVLQFPLSSDESIRFLSELASMMGQEVHAGFVMMPPAEQAEAVGRIPSHKRMAQGEAVFMVNWNNRLQYMRNDVSEALPSIGVAPIPAAEDGQGRASNIGTWGWIVPQASDAATPAAQARHARALRFVEEVSSEEAVTFLSQQTGLIPARRDVAVPEDIRRSLHPDILEALDARGDADPTQAHSFRFQDRGPTFVHGFVRDAIQDVLTCWSNVTKPLPTGLIGDCARYFEECVESNSPGTDCIQRAIRQRLEAAERDIRSAAHRSLL